MPLFLLNLESAREPLRCKDRFFVFGLLLTFLLVSFVLLTRLGVIQLECLVEQRFVDFLEPSLAEQITQLAPQFT